MQAGQAAAAARPRTVVFSAAYAGIVGALSVVVGLIGALDGEGPAVGMALLGLLGLAGAALLWTQPRTGWLVVLAWAVLQIPYFAWSTDGSPLAQVAYLPLSISNKTTVNGEVTSYSEFGINLVGVILAVFFSRWRNEWLRLQR